MDYYSGLDTKDTSKVYEPIDKIEVAGNVAMVVNLEMITELPKEFKRCDVFYAEIPWAGGYNKFNKRAGVKGSDFRYLMWSIYQIVNNTAWRAPVVIVGGKSHFKQLPRPSFIHEVDLNGYPAIAYCYNMKDEGLYFKNYITLIKSLAEKYDRVGDFCCGYGNTGRIFAEHGKGFVMSDINPRCIGYIKEHIHDWLQ